ncbi:FAD dependent oxidoreductase [Mycena sanguinolenta]|uniref:FAD dependent oxidoreductase n=1 Tax=Mycena sanguinolenta TaxID=230812 RepID=A0A8H7DG42_9AGAR|nr:FAD dependent oxidoreductase [Mycena sanguinolenta]
MSVSAAVPLMQLEASLEAFDTVEPKPSSLPVPNPTRSFWIDSAPDANPLAAEGSTGSFTEDADICIIGSGITGVSAAYHLSVAVERGELPRSDKPLRVVILEARDFCKSLWCHRFGFFVCCLLINNLDDPGRNGGHLTPAVFIDFCSYQAKYGTEQAVRCFQLENHTASEIVKIIHEEGWTESVDLVQNGHTTISFTPGEHQDIEADFQAAEAAGMDLANVNWLTKEETQIKYGADYPTVEFGGFNLWPLKFVTRLYQLAKSKSGSHFELNLHTRTPATSISPSLSSSRRWAVGTHRGSLNCSYIIHATNAYASHLLPHLSGPAGIVPTRGQIIAVRANVPADELRKCSWDGNEGFEYWFPRPASSDETPLVILGGGREVESPVFEWGQTDDSSLNDIVGLSLRKFLPAVFPGKFEEGKESEMEWTGIMAYTKLHDPFVGPVLDKSNPDGQSFEGQYISAGYSGHGMPRAFSCGAVVASMVESNITGRPWELPPWFPEPFLTANRLGNTRNV